MEEIKQIAFEVTKEQKQSLKKLAKTKYHLCLGTLLRQYALSLLEQLTLISQPTKREMNELNNTIKKHGDSFDWNEQL